MSTSQVRIQLSTRSPDIELPEDTGPILVSTELRRYQLSTLVNRLLETSQPVPFEFLINGQFLRTSIDEFLTANGISAETTLNVEYVRALVPPAHVASFEHDDWVSAVDVLSTSSAAGKWAGARFAGSGHERLVSASYDGLLRLWNQSQELVATSGDGGHSGPIKSVKFLDSHRVASASNDRSVRIWEYSDSGFTPKVELLGHSASVDRLAVNTPSSRILTASQDHTVGLFSTNKNDNPSAPALPEGYKETKRRRVSTPLSQRGAIVLLSSHTAPVSDVIFKPDDATVAYSTSWDHSLKTWDLATQTCVDTRTTSHSLLSVAALPKLNLVAAGTTARHITLIDPRASATSIVAMTLRGHANAVVSLTPSPDSEYVFASGGHDGSVRVWDVRNAKAGVGAEAGSVGESIFVLERQGAVVDKRPTGGEGVKVFDVKWDRSWGIVSCGEDKKVQINQPN